MSIFGRKSVIKPTEFDLLFTIESVELKGKAAAAKQNAQVLVEVDLPGDEGDLTKTPATPVKVGVASFKPAFAAKYTVSPGSDVRKALVEALQTEAEEDCEVLFNLRAVSDKKVETHLGTASIQLERLLATNTDYKSKILKVEDDKETLVAELKLSTTCLVALQGLQKEVQQNLANIALEKAKSDKQAIVFEATDFNVSSLSAKERPTHAQLKVELMGVKDAVPSTSMAVSLSDGKGEVEFDAPFVAPPGSQLRAQVMAARKKGTLKLRVAIESVVKGKTGKEVRARTLPTPPGASLLQLASGGGTARLAAAR